MSSEQNRLRFHVPRSKAVRANLAELIPTGFARLEVEIGCGKGEFLVQRARSAKDTFFIGIDRRKDRFDLSHKKIDRLNAATQVENCLLIREDARQFLSSGLPPIDCLHIYHPDPWPKARHHKHRFFRSPDAKIWTEAIRADGTLSISTDHKEYFTEIMEILTSFEHLKLLFDFQKRAFMGAPKTHFERLFLNKNEPVFKAIFARTNSTLVDCGEAARD